MKRVWMCILPKKKAIPDRVKNSWKFRLSWHFKILLFGERRFIQNVDDDWEFKHDGDHLFSSAKGNRFPKSPFRSDQRPRRHFFFHSSWLKWRLYYAGDRFSSSDILWLIRPLSRGLHYIRADTKSSRFCHTQDSIEDGQMEIPIHQLCVHLLTYKICRADLVSSNTWDLFSI